MYGLHNTYTAFSWYERDVIRSWFDPFHVCRFFKIDRDASWHVVTHKVQYQKWASHEMYFSFICFAFMSCSKQDAT